MNFQTVYWAIQAERPVDAHIIDATGENREIDAIGSTWCSPQVFHTARAMNKVHGQNPRLC